MHSIGGMRKTGLLKTNTQSTTDGGGGKTDAYTTIVTTRGSLRRRFGDKEDAASQIQFSTTFDWTVRKQDAIVVDKKTIWVIDGKRYKIGDYSTSEESQLYWRFTVTLLDA